MAPSLYTKNTWTDDSTGTPVSAARLTKMETGIYDAHFKPRGAIVCTSIPSVANNTLTEFGVTTGFTAMTWTEEYDSEGWHPGSGMNPGSVRIGLDGIYLCTAFVQFAVNSAGRRELSLSRGGTSFAYHTRRFVGSDSIDQSLLGVQKFLVGDRLSMWVNQTSGSAMTLIGARLTWTLVSYA